MIDVALLPTLLPANLANAQVVVLDVLRATSTIVTALASGARSVHLFGNLEDTRAAKLTLPAPCLLGGERKCLRIEGFDLANSPAEYSVHKVANATIAMTTTNGTVACLAAESAAEVFLGSLLNAAATATALLEHITDRDTILLCAGTENKIAAEDILGAGAILWQLLQQTHSAALPFTDTAWIAYHAFAAVRNHLAPALRLGQGGINLIEAGLEDDIDLCARLNSQPLVVKLSRNPLRALNVTPASSRPAP